ncbi:MAG: hypothetical protein ACTHMS_16240 [Jatrophihabitans sp.]|uniref:hypothetical protein n=1 Tax=Jatrophihabitans sp. TaxID=1932789 RepID=UPI003F7DB674
MTTASLSTHHWHRPSARALRGHGGLRVGLTAVLLAASGVALAGWVLITHLTTAAPAWDRLTDGFRPVMTTQSITASQTDLNRLDTAVGELRTTVLPLLAAQLRTTPAQLQTQLASQFPDFARGLQIAPTAVADFRRTLTELQADRGMFASADAIPTKDVPAATVPWFLLAGGVLLVASGVLAWFRPRAAAACAAVLGVVLITVPLATDLITKTGDADRLNDRLRPVYTSEFVARAGAEATAIDRMGTQLRDQMLPAFASAMHTTPQVLVSNLAGVAPATGALIADGPAASARLHDLVGRFDRHLGDYRDVRSVSFQPLAWFTVAIGALALLAGVVGLLRPTRRSPPPA